jgi:hypothetical protein
MRNILNSKSKKAQEMSVGTIIIIIIAIVVLVFLIIAFTRGGGSLMDNIKNFFGGSSNVDTIKNACSAACTTNQVYEYNTVKRDVKFDKDTRVTGVTCRDLATANTVPSCYVNGAIILQEGIAINEEECSSVKWNSEIGACQYKENDDGALRIINEIPKDKCNGVARPVYSAIVEACPSIPASA